MSFLAATLLAGTFTLSASARMDAIAAEPPEKSDAPESEVERKTRLVRKREAPLRKQREALEECQATPCFTPSEATALAFSVQDGERVPGRFILQINGAGRSRPGAEFDLFFLGSSIDYSAFGVLNLAIDPEVMDDLLNAQPPREAGDFDNGQIVVRADARGPKVPLTARNVLRKFRKKRLIVDGEVYRQWIHRPRGAVSRRYGRGYDQVWVRITSADQISVLPSD